MMGSFVTLGEMKDPFVTPRVNARDIRKWWEVPSHVAVWLIGQL
jgi:hypothetical protein